jgi:PmbA protein
VEKIIDFCKHAFLKIKSNNVSEFEIYGSSAAHNEIEIYEEDIENLSFADTKGLGFRIFKDKRMGYAYTSNLSDSAIDSCIEKAIENSKVTNQEEFNYLPVKKEFMHRDEAFDRNVLYAREFTDFTIEDKIKISKKLELSAKKRDKKIKGISNLIYEDTVSETVILNSLGLEDSYKASAAFLYISVISREGEDVSTGDYFGYERTPQKLNAEDIAENAVKRSISLLGAKKVKSQVADLMLSPMVAIQFLGIIASVIMADSVQKGKSLLAGRIGEKIFSKGFNIIDDGTLPEGLASRPFDGEGVPKGRTSVFEKGVLKTYLYNTYSARKDKRLSTGNASRASYKSPPDIGISNFYLEPSNVTEGKILQKISKGFYVIDVIGLHSGVNPISGQISVGAKGIWIENGVLTYPVKEVTIATDLLRFCKNLAEVGSDLKFMPAGGYIGSPSMHIKDIAISGS